MPAKIDLSSFITDVTATAANAIGYIDAAGRAQKAAADKAAAVRVPATLGASEASSAKMIFQSVDAQQDSILAAGLDPLKVFGPLLNWASTLAQSAKDRLIDAAAASA